MSNNECRNLNRLPAALFTENVIEALPEYFSDDNQLMIDLLQNYYDWMDSDQQFRFPALIRNAINSRDIQSIDQRYLDEIIGEIGNGLTQSSFFNAPRVLARLLGDYYRVKGTKVGTEGFFKAFFNEDVIIEYPKENIFIVGQDNIGYESIKFIQNAEQYQIFSILLKLGLNTRDYETLYKKFAHPAGFHFLGVIQTQTDVDLGLDAFTVDFTDSAELFQRISFTEQAPIRLNTEFATVTGIVDSSAGSSSHRTSLNELVQEYQNITFANLYNFYGTIKTWYNPNSFTFDDSSGYPRPDMSMTFETMDNDWFTRIGSDSAY